MVTVDCFKSMKIMLTEGQGVNNLKVLHNTTVIDNML